MNRAVFIDKDGTLIENIPYNVDPRKVKLYPGVQQALGRLREAGYRIVVISNQPGIAHGFFEESALRGVERKLLSELGSEATIDRFYYCPHHVGGRIPLYTLDCECRKPRPGMILRAAEEMGIDLRASWMIGDILNDVEAGNRAGCRSILINNGNETEWVQGRMRTPFYTAGQVIEAALKILQEGERDERQDKRADGKFQESEGARGRRSNTGQLYKGYNGPAVP
jgi:D-glycero-D-manno-heptose 1,7-bisphosphate phosphatase